ncbi:TMEM175 family protein [Flaviaesturariibacter terrae]
MSDHLQQELKKEFQLERMILFSDAVFAIAITLLAIEIKVPKFDRHSVTDAQLLQQLGEMIPEFIGFLVSFIIIGVYWNVHHRIFGFVVNYNRRLLWMNLYFLLGVVLMPFSSGFYSQYILSGVRTPVIVYCANILLLGGMNLAIWLYVKNPKRGLAQGIDPVESKYFIFRALTPPFMFVVMAIVYANAPRAAFWIPMSIPIVLRIARPFFGKGRKAEVAQAN